MSGPVRAQQKLVRLVILSALAVGTARAVPLTQEEILRQLTPAQIEARLPDASPEDYYLYAGRLLKAGDLDAALRWFYIGQLRFRIYVLAHPQLDPSGAPALLASLTQALGAPLNRYGGQHIDRWLAAIDAALAWDDAHDNAFSPKKDFPEIYAQQRAGLARLKQMILARRSEITQAANGREPMPKGWPALIPVAQCSDLAGVYGRWNLGSVTGVFFTQPAREMQWSTSLEIRAEGKDRILVIARGKNGETGRTIVPVKVKDGAVSFPMSDTIGLSPKGGGSRGTVYLRRNAARDLVMERDEVIEEGHLPGATATLEPHRFWQRALLLKDR
jgi:hypothetical protein